MLIQLSTGDWVNPESVKRIRCEPADFNEDDLLFNVMINNYPVFESLKFKTANKFRDQIAKEINAALQGK